MFLSIITVVAFVFFAAGVGIAVLYTVFSGVLEDRKEPDNKTLLLEIRVYVISMVAMLIGIGLKVIFS